MEHVREINVSRYDPKGKSHIPLEEGYESNKRPLTREQKSHPAKWGNYDREYDYTLTGKLSLRITKGGYEGERRSYSDMATAQLEDRLNKFVIILINAAHGSKRSE